MGKEEHGRECGGITAQMAAVWDSPQTLWEAGTSLCTEITQSAPLTANVTRRSSPCPAASWGELQLKLCLHSHIPCWQHTHLGGGGDGVVTSLQAGQELTQVVDGGAQGGHVLQDGQDVPAGLHHPAEVQRLQARRAQPSQPPHTQLANTPPGSLGAFWGIPQPAARPSWEGQCSHLALSSR